jgi:hypothetical protein
MFAFALIAAVLAAAPAPQVSDRLQVTEAAQASALISAELDDVRGGDAHAVVLTEQNLNAVNSGTIEAGVVNSGAVNIDGSAFSNFEGVGNFVMNTGHLNNIQSSLSVTIIMAPAPGS